MASLRQFMQDIQDPNGDGRGNLGADQPGGDQGDGADRQKVMPTPAYEQDLGSADRSASQKGQAGESPRERLQSQMTGNGGNDAGSIMSTPRQPQTPSPMAGTESMGTGGVGGGVIPFSPMGGPNAADTASPRLRSLYGGASGLTGGGLGVPLDPISNQQSDPINMLMQLIQGRGQA